MDILLMNQRCYCQADVIIAENLSHLPYTVVSQMGF